MYKECSGRKGGGLLEEAKILWVRVPGSLNSTQMVFSESYTAGNIAQVLALRLNHSTSSDPFLEVKIALIFLVSKLLHGTGIKNKASSFPILAHSPFFFFFFSIWARLMSVEPPSSAWEFLRLWAQSHTQQCLGNCIGAECKASALTTLLILWSSNILFYRTYGVSLIKKDNSHVIFSQEKKITKSPIILS